MGKFGWGSKTLCRPPFPFFQQCKLHKGVRCKEIKKNGWQITWHSDYYIVAYSWTGGGSTTGKVSSILSFFDPLQQFFNNAPLMSHTGPQPHAGLDWTAGNTTNMIMYNYFSFLYASSGASTCISASVGCSWAAEDGSIENWTWAEWGVEGRRLRLLVLSTCFTAYRRPVVTPLISLISQTGYGSAVISIITS